MRRAFAADNLWGVAALLWIATGLWRWLAGTEKASGFYLDHPMFHIKLGLFVLILLLELPPMIGLIRWRLAQGRGTRPDTTRAPLFARLSFIEAGVVVLIVLAATAVARGIVPWA